MQFANNHYFLMLCASTRINKPYTLSTNGSMAEAGQRCISQWDTFRPPRTIEPLGPSFAAKTLFLLTSSVEGHAHSRQHLIYSTQQPHTPEPLYPRHTNPFFLLLTTCLQVFQGKLPPSSLHHEAGWRYGGCIYTTAVIYNTCRREQKVHHPKKRLSYIYTLCANSMSFLQLMLFHYWF